MTARILPAPFVVEKDFNGIPVKFRHDGWANATQMARPFNKRPAKFMELPSTVEFIRELEYDLKSNVRFSDITPVLVETRRGQSADGTSGTWVHPILAIEFARWLSPRFAIWTNRIILELFAGRTVDGELARKLWPRHSSLELLAWAQDAMDKMAAQNMRVKEIRGSATELFYAFQKAGYRKCPAPNWLGKWLTDLKHTHGESVAEFSRGHYKREWVIRARPV